MLTKILKLFIIYVFVLAFLDLGCCVGFSLQWLLFFWSTGCRHMGSVVAAHRLCCSTACGIFPDQGSNPCPLHWQVNCLALDHQGSPEIIKLFTLGIIAICSHILVSLPFYFNCDLGKGLQNQCQFVLGRSLLAFIGCFGYSWILFYVRIFLFCWGSWWCVVLCCNHEEVVLVFPHWKDASLDGKIKTLGAAKQFVMGLNWSYSISLISKE